MQVLTYTQGTTTSWNGALQKLHHVSPPTWTLDVYHPDHLRTIKAALIDTAHNVTGEQYQTSGDNEAGVTEEVVRINIIFLFT